MTPQQAGKLGGLTAAQNMTPEQRRERAQKGGRASRAKVGRLYYTQLAYVRHGILKAMPKGGAPIDSTSQPSARR